MFFNQQDMIGANEYDMYGQGLSTVYSGVGSPKHSASGTLKKKLLECIFHNK